MKHFKTYIFVLILSLCVIMSSIGFQAVYADDNFICGGWLETIYAKWNDTDISKSKVEYRKSGETSYFTADSNLIRTEDGGGRVDIPGLSAGSYDIKITAGNGTVYEKTGVAVKAHDRTGYAHYNYPQGVGAYNNDGTPKDNAVIIYITDENKNSVTVPGYESYGTGIGWLLNSNRKLVEALAKDNKPLIVRFVGKVTPPDGLTVYNSSENGGTKGDNGNMCIIKNSKNVTLEGIGTNAIIEGWGFSFYVGADDPASNVYYVNSESYEVRNLTFQKYPEDALGFQGYQDTEKVQTAKLKPIERVWVHNCSFYPGYANPTTDSDKSEGDGSCDFKRGQYYTTSYNYYEGCHKTNLIGANGNNLQFNMTFHHNYYVNCEARQPLIRQANLHLYNSYFKIDIENTNLKPSYIISARDAAYVFSEGNFYDSCKNPVNLDDEKGNGLGVVKSYNDVFFNTSEANQAVIVTDRNQAVPSSCKYANFDTAPDFYTYTSTSAAQAKADCKAFSGVMKTHEEIVKNKNPTPEPLFKEPANAVSIPFSVTFDDTSADDHFGKLLAANGVSKELAAGEEKEINNVIYKAGKKYGLTGTQYTMKDNGVIFKTDKKCVAAIKAGSGTVGVSIYNSKGTCLTTVKNLKKYVLLEPDTYLIQSSLSTKESVLGSLALTEYKEGDEIPGNEDKETVHILDLTNNINTNDFFAYSGSSATSSGYTVDLNGQTLKKFLKLNNKTNITFTTKKKAKITLLAIPKTGDSAAIALDNTSVTVEKGKENVFDLEPGSHTIKKDKVETYIFYIKTEEETSEPINPNPGDEDFRNKGDVDGDGSVTINDASVLMKYVLDKKENPLDEKSLAAARITESDDDISAKEVAYIIMTVLNSTIK